MGLPEPRVVRHPHIAVAILAGGRGSRFVPHKGLIELAGKPIMERVVDRLAPLSQHLMVIGTAGGDWAPADVVCVEDERGGLGPLGGIHTALLHAPTSHCFVVAWDMPFVSPELSGYLMELAPEYDVVVPAVRGHLEALHAVYSKACLGAIERQIAAGEKKIIVFYEEVSVRRVKEEEIARFGPPERLFFNVNTEADLLRAARMIEEERDGCLS